MKTSALWLGLICVMTTFVRAEVLEPVWLFTQPSLKLKNGKVSFLCKQQDELLAGGLPILKFDLALEPNDRLAISELFEGFEYANGTSRFAAASIPLDHINGRILFSGSDHERISLEINYSGKPLGKISKTVIEQEESLAIGQDWESKIVTAHYRNKLFFELNKPGCSSTPDGCNRERSDVIWDSFYLCQRIVAPVLSPTSGYSP